MNSNTHTITICCDLQEAFQRKFLSTGTSKLHIHKSNFRCLQTSTAVLYYITQKTPIETDYSYYTVSHLNMLNYEAQVWLPGSRFACPPCCYCQSKEIKKQPSCPLQVHAF